MQRTQRLTAALAALAAAPMPSGLGIRHKFRNPELARMAEIAARYDARLGYIDAQNLYSDAQALVATAVSTNLIDHGQDRNLGIGTPLAVITTIDVLAVTAGTLTIQLQTDDNVGFASPTVIATSRALATAELLAGAQFTVDVPADTLIERFTRLNYVIVTITSVTVTSFLAQKNMVQNAINYASSVNPLT